MDFNAELERRTVRIYTPPTATYDIVGEWTDVCSVASSTDRMDGESVTMTFNMAALKIKIADVLRFSKVPTSCRGARSMHRKRVLQAEVISMWARARHSARTRTSCVVTIGTEPRGAACQF